MNKKGINYHLFTKNSKVCTQLKIFQQEIKSNLNQELMHKLGERGLDAPKSILETEKPQKLSLLGKYIKKQKKQKKQKKSKKTHWTGFFITNASTAIHSYCIAPVV
jgi:hypothetical protein